MAFFESEEDVRNVFPVTKNSPSVLLDILQVITTDNDGSLHFGGHNDTSEDAPTNRNVSSEWAFLIDVTSINGSLGGLEAKSNTLEVSHSLRE